MSFLRKFADFPDFREISAFKNGHALHVTFLAKNGSKNGQFLTKNDQKGAKIAQRRIKKWNLIAEFAI